MKRGSKTGAPPREPPDDPAVVADEVAILADVASGLVLDHPDAHLFTGRLIEFRDRLRALLDELRVRALLVELRAVSLQTNGTPRPWAPGPFDLPPRPTNDVPRRRREFTGQEKADIRRRVKAGEVQSTIAAEFHVNRERISAIIRGEEGGGDATP
jgi:hypothetical protein